MQELENRPRALVRLIYASRAVGDVASDKVQAIIAKSIQNNRVADITGLLVTGNGRFLQLLEGPPGSVDETFERICQDPRHGDVVILFKGRGERRMFRDWNMAQRRLSPEDAGFLADVGLETFTPDGLDEDRALRFLRAVGRTHLK